MYRESSLPIPCADHRKKNVVFDTIRFKNLVGCTSRNFWFARRFALLSNATTTALTKLHRDPIAQGRIRQLHTQVLTESSTNNPL